MPQSAEFMKRIGRLGGRPTRAEASAKEWAKLAREEEALKKQGYRNRKPQSPADPNDVFFGAEEAWRR